MNNDIRFIPSGNEPETDELRAKEEAAFREHEKIAAVQREALNTLDKIYKDFIGHDDDGGEVYPEEFAGTEIDGTKLIVYLTTTDESTISKYREATDNTCVEFKQAKFSLNELNRIRDAVTPEFAKRISYVGSAANAHTNKIHIYTQDDSEDAVKALESIFNSRNLHSNLDAAKSLDIGLFKLIKSEPDVPHVNMRGGMRHYIGSTSGGYGTVGVCGTVSNEYGTWPGYATHGHNLAISGTNMNLYISGAKYGECRVQLYRDGARGDFGCVARTNSNFVQTNVIYGSSSGYIRYITAYADNATLDASVMKYGSANGYCRGTVVEINYDAYYERDNLTVRGLTRMRIIEGTSGSGDSGGPCYNSVSGSDYRFLGVHSGGSVTYGNFTPYGIFKTWFVPQTS